MTPEYGRPGTKAAALRAWLHRAVIAHRENPETIPTTNRFLYYEALMRSGLVAKKEAGLGGRRPDQDVSVAMLWLREQGLVEWSEIVDRTRHVADYTGERSILEGARAAIQRIRLDPWAGRPPLLIVESESLAGLLDVTIAYVYRLVLVPVRGQSSAALLVNDVRPYIERGSTEVFYLGDADKAGADIEASARERLERFSNRRLKWTRIALTEEQVDAYRLPRVSRKDGRDGRTRLVAECEAMPQAELLRLVREALDTLLPTPLDRVRVREERERRAVLRRLETT